MTDLIYTQTISGAGTVIGGRPAIRTGDAVIRHEVTLAAALACTSWTKTDANTGNCDEPDGWSAGTYDVYWSGGMRYGVDATDLGGGTIQLDGGSGDDFPASATAITICEQTQINTQIDGDNVVIFGAHLVYSDSDSTSAGHIDMQDSGSSTIEEIDLSANEAYVLDVDGGDTNVLTGNPITKTLASHNDSSNTATLRILSLEDSTP